MSFKVIEGLKRASALLFSQHRSETITRGKRVRQPKTLGPFYNTIWLKKFNLESTEAEFPRTLNSQPQSGLGRFRVCVCDGERSDSKIHCTSRGCLQVEQGPTGSLASRGLILNCIIFASGAKCVRFAPFPSAIHHPALYAMSARILSFGFLIWASAGTLTFQYSVTVARAFNPQPPPPPIWCERSRGPRAKFSATTVQAGNLSGLQLQHMNHH